MAPEDSFREMTATFDQLAPEERIRTVLRHGEPGKKRLTAAFIGEQCKLKSFERISETIAKATYTFRVEHFYCNGSGNLQGTLTPKVSMPLLEYSNAWLQAAHNP